MFCAEDVSQGHEKRVLDAHLCAKQAFGVCLIFDVLYFDADVLSD